MFRRRTSSPGKDSVIPREGGRPRPSGPPRPTTAPHVLFGFSMYCLRPDIKNSYLWNKTTIMFRDILHKIKIFFCDDDIEKINVRDSTVIRNNEILNELCDLATVVSRNYVYGRIKDRTGLSIRHISRIINHTKVEEI